MKRKTHSKQIHRQANKVMLATGVVVFIIFILSFVLQNRSVAETDLVVYKKSSCQCCMRWVSHLRENNLRVNVINVQKLQSIREKYKVPSMLTSCHTAVAGNYVIEGHVPADLVHLLLKERPIAQGLAVPGMPIGSPGMEGPSPETYEVLLFDQQGNTNVYATLLGKHGGS